jgi:sialidase-1
MHTSTAFTSGESGYNCIRIPTIVKAANGNLLAFAEGRVNSCSDFGNIDLIMKTSSDGGRTWGPLQVLDNNGTDRTGNASPILDANTGTIVLPMMRGDQPYVMRSTNNGAFWTGPFPIASQVFPSEWSSMGIGPVHGIQLQNGPNAGRLVVSGKHILAGQTLEPDGRESHVMYSDDGGFTWAVGGSLKNPSAGFGPNESTVVELSDGSLYLSARNQGGGARNRLVGISPDGVLDFDGDPNDGVNSSIVESSLADAQVQGSLLRLPSHRIVHSHIANDTTDRYHLSISSSFDDTQTWVNRKLISRTLAAYSDLTMIQGNEVGFIYESGHTGDVDTIRFAWFDESWLDNPTVLHYNFDAVNLNSTGGNHRVASVDGFDYSGQAVSYLTTVPGSPDYEGGGALRFSTLSSGDAIRIDDAADVNNLEFEHEDSFTIEAVFKTVNHGSNTGVIFDKNGTGSTNGRYTLEVADGKLRFHLKDLLGNQASVLSATGVNDGEWHHVAAVRDAVSHLIYLYVDQQLVGTAADLTTSDFGEIALGQAETPVIGSDAQGLYQFGGDLQHLKISMAALGVDQFLQKIAQPLLGDLDGDGFVGINDLNIILSNWNQSVTPNDLQLGDPSGDGFVGIEDLNIVLGNWNSGTPPELSNVPEPGWAAYMSIAFVRLVLRDRKLKTWSSGI